MAKGMYVGVADKARKVKSIYVGVDGKARKVKKVYVGDANGKARLCWSAELPVMSGTFTQSSRSTSVTISNIPFKPKGIMVMSTYVGYVGNNSTRYYSTRLVLPTGTWLYLNNDGCSVRTLH